MNNSSLRGVTVGQSRETAAAGNYPCAEPTTPAPCPARDIPEAIGSLVIATSLLEEALERMAKRLDHVRRSCPCPAAPEEKPTPKSVIAEAITNQTERVNRVTRLLNMLEGEVQL